MIRQKQYWVLVIIFPGCNNSDQKNIHPIDEKTSLAGVYRYANKMEFPNECEVAIHELKLNIDSSFNLKLYCDGNAASSLRMINASGKWGLQNDSILTCNSPDTLFYLKIISQYSLAVIPTTPKKYISAYTRVLQ